MTPIAAPKQENENQRDVNFTAPGQPIDCNSRFSAQARVKTGKPPPSANSVVQVIAPAVPSRNARLPPIRSASPPLMNFPMAYAKTPIDASAPSLTFALFASQPLVARSSMISGSVTEKFDRQR